MRAAACLPGVILCLAGAVLVVACAPRLAAVRPSGSPQAVGDIPLVDVIAAESTLPRSATFAGASFTVVSARVTNAHPYTIFGEPRPGRQLYGVLTVQGTNTTTERIPYVFNDAAFRLRTYSGAVTAAVDPIGGYEFAGLSAEAAGLEDTVVFPVRAEDAFEGAALLIGEPPDVPAILELTAPQAPGTSAPIAAADGGAVRVGPLAWTVLGGEVGVDRPAGLCCPATGVRANEDERYLTLRLRAVVRGSQYGRATISTDLVALVVDGVALEPIRYAGQANVAEDSSYELEPTWLIDAGASTLQLRLSSEDAGSRTIDLQVTPS